MSKRIAQAGVILFGLVFVPSVAMVVRGSQHPSYYHPIAKGEMFPAISLTDTFGQTAPLHASGDAHLMLVRTSSPHMTAAQRDWIARLAARVEAVVPLRTVVVTTERDSTVPATTICPTASSLLVDEDRALLPLLGGKAAQAVVCIMDPGGRVVFRAGVPDAADASTQIAELNAAELMPITGSARQLAQRP